MTTQTAARRRVRYYRYGPHVVQIVRDMSENGDKTETLSITRNGGKAAELRGGHGYARLPKRWRVKIKEELKHDGS